MVDDYKKRVNDLKEIAIGMLGYLDSMGDNGYAPDALKELDNYSRCINQGTKKIVNMFSPKPEGIETLTKREIEVMGYVAQGLSNKQIGEEMIISDNTVKNYVRKIYLKTDALSRAHIAVLYERHFRPNL